MLTLSSSRREIFLRCFFQILLALEFLFLCYVNLRLTSHILDGDGADLYGHIIEMAEQGTILLPGWKYTTTMELDCVTLLALPLYLLTHRIFGSVGIANILLILLLAAVILRVVKNLGGTDLQGYFSLLLVLLPYDVGMLDYMDMLLFGGSQYIIKVLVPLLLVILLTEKTRTRSGIFFAVLYGFLLFVTSLSSGPYVLLMGLFPLFLYRIFPWCQAGTQADRDKIRRFVFLLLLTLAASLSGFLLQKALGITTRESELHLIQFEDLSTALLAIVSGLLDVLGVYPTTSAVPAFSAAGISSLLKGSFTFLVLGIGGIVLYRAVKKQTRKEAGGSPPCRRPPLYDPHHVLRGYEIQHGKYLRGVPVLSDRDGDAAHPCRHEAGAPARARAHPCHRGIPGGSCCNERSLRQQRRKRRKELRLLL